MEEDKKQPIQYRAIWKMTAPFLRQHRLLGIGLVIVGFASTALWVVQPYLYGKIVDGILQAVRGNNQILSGFTLIRPYFIWFVVTVLGIIGTSALYEYALWYYSNHATGLFTDALYKHLLRLDIARYHEERSGELLRRLSNGEDAFSNVIRYVYKSVFNALFQFSLALAIGFFIDWRLTIIALAPAPLIVVIAIYTLRVVSPAQRKMHKLFEKVYGHMGDTFGNIAAVKNFNLEKKSVRTAWNMFLAGFVPQNKVNLQWGITGGIDGAITTGGRLMIFLFGAYLVLHGKATIGSLVTFLGFTSLFYGAIDSLVQPLPHMSRELTRLNRVLLLWQEVPKVQDLPQAQSVRELHGDIRFNGTRFSYKENQQILHGIDFRIPEGETLALVGQSGAGKSTIAQLLVRFYDPTGGSITIGGKDIRSITLESLRRNVGFVMQENLLFHDTIYNNIALAKPGAKRKEVEAAAKRAQAHEFISHLPDKYESIVGERGVKLSGGEKQRIALARVLLADPPILVLDEATSALDSKTEHDLQAALREVMKNRTTLVIAHRLSTVMHADNILVLDKGRVVDQGKHDELIARGGLYKEYWEIQAGGYVG